MPVGIAHVAPQHSHTTSVGSHLMCGTVQGSEGKGIKDQDSQTLSGGDNYDV